MEYVLLSKTNCMVSRTALSTDSLENYPLEDGVALMRKAYDGGVNFYHSSSQHKEILGYAFHGMRKEVFISIESLASDSLTLQQEIIATLDSLNSSYIDVFSVQNNNFVPKKDSTDGLYTALLAAKADDNVKSIGFSTKKFDLAKEALESKLYDVIFLETSIKSLDVKETINFIKNCKNNDIGLVINYEIPVSEELEFPLVFGFLRKYENLIPIWKIKNQEDLQQILYFESNPPEFTDKDLEEIEKKQDSN